MNKERSIAAARCSSEGFDGRPMPPIPVGSRVKMSALGAARCPRIAEKQGIIVGTGRYSNSIRILFDGSKLPVSLHRDYVEQTPIRSE
jgi:hypothetical protein